MRTAVLILLLICSSAHADEWKAVDYTMLGAATTLLVVDWGQTRDLTNGSECTRWVDNVTPTGIGQRKETYPCRVQKESNPILGDYPTKQEVDRYFALALIGTAGLAYILPHTYRRWFLGGVIVLQSYHVYRNHQVGLKIDF